VSKVINPVLPKRSRCAAKTCGTLFPPQKAEDLEQQYEINKGRPEARSLLRFEMTPAQTGFPHVAQAAKMLRFCERKTEKEYICQKS